MLKTGILNPQLLSLLARVRHTNMLVIADRGFPYWPMIETVDLSLIDDVPTVLQVFEAVRDSCDIGEIFMAQEFLDENTGAVKAAFSAALKGIPVTYEPHTLFKEKVPQAIGLIRTGDTTQYGNMIIVSEQPPEDA
jgi:D-ribose pyranase